MVMKIRATLEIPDRSITRTKLEYPTEDVSYAYLASIERTRVYRDMRWVHNWTILTYDIFSDRAVEVYLVIGSCDSVFGRHRLGDRYYTQIVTESATDDHLIHKFISGSETLLGREAVDLIAGSPERFIHSNSGSTLKSFRGYVTTPQITVTDTELASGYFGFATRHDKAVQNIGLAWLRPPSTPAPPALAVLEVEVEGSGAPEDPYRPLTLEDHIEVTETLEIPDYIKHEAKKYNMLKSKGYTDDEIKLLLGYIPQHQIDLASVTWGAFEFSPNSPTNIIVITGDNPYMSEAIQKHIELTRSKNMRVLKPPKNYEEAVAQYNSIKRDYPYWLAGKDNYVYQTLGLEELDLFQNVDFYFGELVEHKAHYQQLKNIPDWELWRRLEKLERRLEKVEVLTEERDKHISKVKEVKRLGW
jgi:hypothetical protein